MYRKRFLVISLILSDEFELGSATDIDRLLVSVRLCLQDCLPPIFALIGKHEFWSCQAVLYAELFFFLGCKQRFSWFQVSFSPVKRGNRAGSPRNEFDYSRRGTQTGFPLLDCRSCANFELIRTSQMCSQKTGRWSKKGAPFDQLFFSSKKIEKWASPKFSQLRQSRSRKLVWVPLRE